MEVCTELSIERRRMEAASMKMCAWLAYFWSDACKYEFPTRSACSNVAFFFRGVNQRHGDVSSGAPSQKAALTSSIP